METNPVKGVKRPKVESYEGKTPALGDHQARKLLNAPATDTLKGKRDRAILSTLLYRALRREELVTLKVKDIHERRGVKHFRVHGKGGKIRYVPAYAGTLELITDYLEAAGHAAHQDGALFRPIQNNVTGRLNIAMTAHAVYAHVVRHYGKKIGLDGARLGAARAVRDRRDQRARPRGGHRARAGVARTRQHRDDADLRPAQNAARRQPNVQGSVLMCRNQDLIWQPVSDRRCP